ncbi:MAG: HlyD family efflux transporter periplasmic adaptor subunit [Planctomycetota bacterium]
MSSKPADQPAIDLNALDVLLDSFTQMGSDPSTDRVNFYATVNRQLAACTESTAAIVVVKNQTGQTRVVHQHGFDAFPPQTRSALNTAIQQNVKTALAESKHGCQSVSGLKLVFARCRSASELEFLFGLIRPGDENALAEQVHRDLAVEIASQIEIFENNKSANKSPRSVAQLTQFSRLAQNLGKASTTHELAFHLVNDLAKITRADRVTFFSPSGRILAISGVSQVSQRTEVAKKLSKIARIAIRSGGIEWHGETLEVDAPKRPRGLTSLIADLPADAGYAVPIRHQSAACGALLFEKFETDEATRFDDRELINEAVTFASPVIDRNLRTHAIPGFAVLDWLFNRIVVRSVRSAILWLTCLGLMIAAAYWLFAMERPFEIYGEGTLETVQQQHVFSHSDGEVERLLVDDGDEVQADQTLLTIRSKDLEKEIVTVRGKIEETETELRTLKLSGFRDPSSDEFDEAKTASDIQRLEIRLKTLQAQRDFYIIKEKQLEIRAPISGSVTTQNIRQKLVDRPINRTDLLLTISNTQGEWELELQIPDNRIEFVKRAIETNPEPLDVLFRLTADSSQTFTGKLERIDYRAQMDPESQMPIVVAYVSIDETELGDSLRLGTRVYGKIACGQRSNVFLLTYEVRNRINQWLFR